jgi:hypothetical protein
LLARATKLQRGMRGLTGLILGRGRLLSACGVNPVTRKKEIQFVSEAQELQIGGAGAGLQMVQMKYGRDQELESDLRHEVHEARGL